MKRCFILDENTVVAAYRGKNERGEPDLSAAKLLLDIAYNCHLIAVDSELRNKYSERADQLERTRQVMITNVANIIHNMLKDTGKTKFFEQAPDVEMPKSVHDDNHHIIRLAIYSHGLLVTTNGRLRDALLNANLIQKHGLAVMRPEEAVRYAGPDPEPNRL